MMTLNYILFVVQSVLQWVKSLVMTYIWLTFLLQKVDLSQQSLMGLVEKDVYH